MFDGVAEHGFAERDCFFTKSLIFQFVFFFFSLFLFNDLIHKCLKLC